MAVVTLSPKLSERVEETAKRRGVDVEALIEELIGPADAVTDDTAAIDAALNDFAQGRCRDAADFFAEHREKYPEPR